MWFPSWTVSYFSSPHMALPSPLKSGARTVGFGVGLQAPSVLSSPPFVMSPPVSVPTSVAVSSPANLLSAQDPQDGVEGKIRLWLNAIPIGTGEERGWDDSQILEIAEFAQAMHLEDLSAEDIYVRYVEHKVEEAEKSSNSG